MNKPLKNFSKPIKISQQHISVGHGKLDIPYVLMMMVSLQAQQVGPF
jgi:hypothetical protein